MPEQTTLENRIEQLQRMADNIAWNLGTGRKHKVSDLVFGEFHYSLWDVTLTDRDLHIASKGGLLLDRPKFSKTTITYKGRMVLNVEDINSKTSPTYIPGKTWEEKLEKLYFEE